MSHDHDDRPQLTAAQAAAVMNPPAGRNGGDLVVESLQGLGATTVFGLPGQHALGMFDALRRSSLSYVGLRVENNAGFAADAYGRITGRSRRCSCPPGPARSPRSPRSRRRPPPPHPSSRSPARSPRPGSAAGGTAISTSCATSRPPSATS